MNAKELIGLLKVSIQNKLRLLVVGPPGCGKTAIVRQVCKDLSVPLVFLHPAVSDPTDFKGLPGIVNGQAEFLAYGDMRHLSEVKTRTVVFADDLGQAPTSVQAALMQPLHGGVINSHKLSEELVWVAATNDTKDCAGVSGLIEPLKSRFHSIVKLETTLEDWREWAVRNEMPVSLIAYLSKFPQQLNMFTPTKQLSNSPCPRNWEAVGRWLNAGVTSPEVLAGSIGQAVAAQLVLFLGSMDKLPALDDILARPDSTEVPREGHYRWAVAVGLAQVVRQNTVAPALAYLSRMNKSFEVLFIKTMLARDSSLANCHAYVTWATDKTNASMLL